SSKPDIVG
nr:Chain M, NprX peptide [synthetic construct]4GPK_N Chain N, NprX peptide [synthetic construct]4GPK_O Chain O, NprX peptide [synthetic construct]4GPK_P Chain P, NprX peptide [synthetic construct]4GPK_Q Chain Q, NprX peptide [synthetic construct]4GPK_R Chain R, NprX peptide [synthetic construct]4GPK_S Chain S, NprX peptide [synthetic construct]4GPK_T Chain T, NprX peptide [synthetic construct]4GPK_U Chain U, NprX peptide [synthetic construct]4GPK_V Chain V, NprX peptide [synthetic construc